MAREDTAPGALDDPTAFKGQWWSRRGYQFARLSAVRSLCIRALKEAGLEEADALFTVDTLLDKDLQGDHLRGIADVPRWVSAFLSGAADPRPRLHILQETKNSALVGEDPQGFYLSIARKSMDLCIQKAKREGIATVGVRKNLGTLVPLLKMAVEADLIAHGVIQGPPTIAPTGGKKPVVGNNPVGFGIPADKMPPVVLDTALSQSSATPIFAAAARGERVPPGLLLDSEGCPTTDPTVFARPPKQAHRDKASQYWASQPGSFTLAGSLMPIGGYKGYSLALVYGILSSVLVASHPSTNATKEPWYYQHPGTLLIAMDPSLFCDLDTFKRGVDKELLRVTQISRKTGVRRLFYPGQRSHEMQEQGRREDRVHIPGAARKALERLADELHIPADLRAPSTNPSRKARKK